MLVEILNAQLERNGYCNHRRHVVPVLATQTRTINTLTPLFQAPIDNGLRAQRLAAKSDEAQIEARLVHLVFAEPPVKWMCCLILAAREHALVLIAWVACLVYRLKWGYYIEVRRQGEKYIGTSIAFLLYRCSVGLYVVSSMSGN